MKDSGFGKKILFLPAILLAFSAFLLGSLSGCVSASQPGADASKNPEAKQENLTVYGKETETAIKVKLENVTSNTILGLAIKPSSSETYLDLAIPSGSKIMIGETVLLFFEPLKQTDGFVGAQSSGGLQTSDATAQTAYDLKLTFFDGSTAELHALYLAELDAITAIVSKDGFFYVEYLGQNGQKGSTLEMERSFLLDRETEAAARDKATQGQLQYDNDENTGGITGGQTQDQCVDDLIFR